MSKAVLFSNAFGYTLKADPPPKVNTPVYMAPSYLRVGVPNARGPWLKSKASVAGVPYGGFWDSFKNSLFIQPNKIDLGLVLSPSTHTIRVWSSHEQSITAPNIAATGNGGMSLTGTTSNITLDAFGGYKDYTLDVSLSVAGVIDAKYSWDFPGLPESVKLLNVIGQRIVVFGIPPQKRMVEKLSWKTDVIRTLDGAEQRIRIRENPMSTIRYKSVTGYLDTAGAEALIYRLGHDDVAIPLWHEGVRYPGVIAAGVIRIDVSTAASSFAVDDLVILWKDFFTYETATIATVAADHITLKKPLVGTWDRPLVAPLAYGLVDNVTFSKYKINVSENNVEYTRNDTVSIAGSATYPLYDGIPVYGKLLYMSGKSSPAAYTPSVDSLDYGIKPRSQKKRYDFPDVTRDILVKMYSPLEVMNFKKFLTYLGGKQKPFWYVSDWWDFNPVGNTPTTETVIRIQDMGFLEYYAGAVNRKWLAIKPKGGAWVYRQVSSVAKGADIPGEPKNEAITIDTALPFTFSKDTVEKISLMVPVRLQQDEVTFNWDGMEHITASLRVVEVTK
ncbi:tail assembly structural protein [Vibrio phage vB_VpaS_KF6]|uniref:Tail assembly structural protein n=1 Tax=Vibrio phage vB_VpaS_KF6 TaxID=2041477 RepID=A0A384WK46_9CAUD|nr:tail assembly structural protein [Vibrio phage vB_VpaS_KF6]